MKDDLKIFRGMPYKVNDYITINQPTLGEIEEWGEGEYFSIVYNIVATPTDMKYQLSQIGKDWNNVTDYELFLDTYKNYTPERTGILFGDLDFTQYEIYKNKQNDELVLFNPTDNSAIDRSVYEMITSYLRQAHSIKKNVERAMTETTREVLLMEAEENYIASQNEPFHSILLPLIDTMCCMPGFKYNQDTVWGMHINAFMSAVKRIGHIKNADLMLTSGYSGFGIDLKKIKKSKLNYFDENLD